MRPHHLGAAAVLLLFAACVAPVPAAEATVVEPGDHVIGTGTIVLDERGEVCLYDLVLNLGGKPRPIEACPPSSVPIQGVDVSGLPGWMAIGDSGYSSLVTVRGTWSGNALVADTVVAGSSGPRPEPDVPCPPPAGGWPGPGEPTVDLEVGLRRLGVELERDPARYSGYWLASASGSAGLPTVAVVGTVADPAEVQEDLQSIYPYGLCVVRVEYATVDLERAASQLSGPDGIWETRISPELNRVIVRLPLVDRAADAVLSAHPEATADPLVWPSVPATRESVS